MAKRKKRPPLWFEPYETARRLEEEFHRAMAEMWRRPFEFRFRLPRLEVPRELVRTIPVDVIDTDKELIVRAELPGFEKDEISLKVTPTAIDISAERKRERIERADTFYRRERAYGAARRYMSLPAEIIPEKVRAKFEAGVLEIVLPKKIVKKPLAKKVKIA